MKNLLFPLLLAACLVTGAAAQPKTNDAIRRQIKTIGGDKTFTLSYDAGSRVSKLMGVTGNFDDSDAGRAGIRAMNFAVGFIYVGETLEKAPERATLAFWVLTKRPRFATNHNLLVRNESPLDLGPARYVSRERDEMEYLNFEISLGDLAKIAGSPTGRFQLGEAEFTFTRSQLKTISDLLLLADPSR